MVYDEDSKEEVFWKNIQSGEAFGELALLYDAPRSATITALMDCSCWVLDRTTFKSIIMASAVRERSIRLQFLDNIKVFEKMDRYKKIKLLDGLEVQNYNKDSVIVWENEIGEYFYMIESGEVHCVKTEGEDKQTFVRALKEGDYFGEIALMEDDSKRTLTVIAAQDTKLLAMAKKTFFTCLGEFSNYLQKDYDV